MISISVFHFVNYKKYQGVSLTKKGRSTAISIIRKHRLWETFLVNNLNFSWDEVHDVAEQLEILEERLNQRGNEPPQLIVKRLKRFPLEIEYKEKFMFHFVNEELDETIKDIEKVIKENIK
mgnify:CR=1 FL=1